MLTKRDNSVRTLIQEDLEKGIPTLLAAANAQKSGKTV